MPSLFDGLVRPNAVVRIESVSVSQGAEGGTVETYSTLTDDVDVLISQVSAGRSDDLGGRHNVLTGTMSGEAAGMARADVRYLVKTTTTGYPLTNVYLYPTGPSAHGAAPDPYIPAAFYRVNFSSVRTT